MNATSPNPLKPAAWQVVCLCAAWCRTCDGYRATFEAVAAHFPGWHFEWVDIEDQSDLIDDYDVETFPCLLVGQDLTLAFAGPLTPQPETLLRLLQSLAQQSPVKPALNAEASSLALWARLQAAH